jgi:chorismate synthase
MWGIHVRENWRAIRVQHRTLAKTIKAKNTTQKAKRMSSTDSHKPGVNPGVREGLPVAVHVSYKTQVSIFMSGKQILLVSEERKNIRKEKIHRLLINEYEHKCTL